MKVQLNCLKVHLHCTCCLRSWGGGLRLQILPPGAVTGGEVMMGILPPASLRSPSEGGTGGQQGVEAAGTRLGREPAGRTNVCGSAVQAHCVPRAHRTGVPVCMANGAGGKGQVFTSVAPKYPLLGIFE